jgi:hypothetical protein
MAAVTDAKIAEVASKLWLDVYEAAFRGKDRGRFCLTREQLKHALGTDRLHASTIERLQDEARSKGLVIIDLDDIFPCVEVRVVRKYRRPPTTFFNEIFPEEEEEGDPEEEEEDDAGAA